MSTDDHYQEPEPSGDDTYDEPLLEWIGHTVIAEWAGREVEGVVVDISLPHEGHTFGEQLIVETGAGASISVSPDDVLSSTLWEVDNG